MLLFVYGTMMQRGRNWPRLYEQGAVRIGDEFTTMDLFDLYIGHGNIAPLAVRNPGGLPIAGELYAVEDAKVLGSIDPCEGHPDMYRREPVTLLRFNEESHLAVYMYVYRHKIAVVDRRILPRDGDCDLNGLTVLRYDPSLIAA